MGKQHRAGELKVQSRADTEIPGRLLKLCSLLINKIQPVT